MKTLHQRLTNKTKVQLIAANKKHPIIVQDIRNTLKKHTYVHALPFYIACDLCTFVLDSYGISRSIVMDAFKPLLDD